MENFERWDIPWFMVGVPCVLQQPIVLLAFFTYMVLVWDGNGVLRRGLTNFDFPEFV